MNKTILVLTDGLRPDALLGCGHPYVNELIRDSAYTFKARTVIPSVTLPCHFSLFVSAPPERHGIVTNVYTPQVRPIDGLCERLSDAGRNCAFFYNWAELRDLARPGSLVHEQLFNMYHMSDSDGRVAAAAAGFIEAEKPDFAFVYMGTTDETGHNKGWMTEPYLKTVNSAVGHMRDLIEKFGDEYVFVITADHGGHDRKHGTELDEDMTWISPPPLRRCWRLRLRANGKVKVCYERRQRRSKTALDLSGNPRVRSVFYQLSDAS